MIESQTGAVIRNYKYVKLSCTKHSFSTKKMSCVLRNHIEPFLEETIKW